MEDKKTFKSKWEETDEVCPLCKKVTKRCRGLTRQNMKNFLKKPTMQDWIILIMLLLTLLGAWAYDQEVGAYREVIRDPQELCMFYWSNVQHGNFVGRVAYDKISFNLTNNSISPS